MGWGGPKGGDEGIRIRGIQGLWPVRAHREPPRCPGRPYNFRPSGLPRRPVGSRGTKRRRTLRKHGQNAYSRRPLSIHTPHGVAFPSGSRPPDFSRFRCPPGFSRALPETPVPGVLLERTRSNTPLTLIGLPTVSIFTRPVRAAAYRCTPALFSQKTIVFLGSLNCGRVLWGGSGPSCVYGSQ